MPDLSLPSTHRPSIQQEFLGTINAGPGSTVGTHNNYFSGRTTPSLFDLVEQSVNDNVAYNSRERELEEVCLCQADTRERVLQDLKSWYESSDGSPLCWLHGPAGTGKSTIAHTVSHDLDNQSPKKLAFSYFFSRRNPHRSDLSKFIPTITHQIAKVSTEFKEALQRAPADRSILQYNIGEQCHQLIAAHLPLNSFSGIAVLDGLDEYNVDVGKSALRVWLPTLIKAFSRLPIRLLLTSRNEDYIREILHDSSIADQIHTIGLHDTKFDAHSDVRSYLCAELGKVGIRRRIPSPWPTQDDLSRVADQSDGLFMYAATLVKFVSSEQEDPHQQLKFVMQAHTGLDSLYAQILEQANRYHQFDLVFGPVLCLRDALSIRDLSDLLRLEPSAIRTALRGCHSVLLVPDDDEEYIRPFHASLKDYLTDAGRAKRNIILKHHRSLFENCIMILSGDIARDSDWKQCLEYSYLNWAHHLYSASSNVSEAQSIDRSWSGKIQLVTKGLIPGWWGCVPKLEGHEGLGRLCDDLNALLTITKRDRRVLTRWQIRKVLRFIQKFVCHCLRLLGVVLTISG